MDGVDAVVIFVGGGATRHPDGFGRFQAELGRKRFNEGAEQVQAQGAAFFEQVAHFRIDDGHDHDGAVAVLDLCGGDAGQHVARLLDVIGEG